ncbi:MAG: hypothetical protein HC941_03380 [Microcoleus sp. SU_5_3]|nr:hypothetical protein [Microcoleus sp. SU_5_3]
MERALGKWIVSGFPGLEYVMAGYLLVGMIVGILGLFLFFYLLNCLVSNKDPLKYSDPLSQQPKKYKVLVKVCIAYIALNFFLLFVPYGGLSSGILGHLVLMLWMISNAPKDSGAGFVFIFGIILMGIIGWGAIDSGIISLENSQGWTFEDEMRRGEQFENQRQKMIQECYAKGGDSLICDR